MNNFLGVRIFESPFCVRDVPIRKHKHRHHQSMAYHLRIQKKWNKRFGMKKEHFALMVSPKLAGLPGCDYVALSPHSMGLLRDISFPAHMP